MNGGSRRPSPATAIAFAALLVAVGGVAFATIPDRSGRIHGCYLRQASVDDDGGRQGSLRLVDSPTQCKSDEAAISWNQNGPPASGGATLARDVRPGEIRTNSDVPVDRGGPRVTVNVPVGALVGIFVSLEGKDCGTSAAIARVFEPTDFSLIDPQTRGPQVVVNGSDWTRAYSIPHGFNSGDHTIRSEAGFATVYPATPGTRTYSLRYLKGGSGPQCVVSFRNRQLWIRTIPLHARD